MKLLQCTTLAILLACSATAQQIRYLFEAPNAVHHEAEITIMASKLAKGALIFKMSRSSPGRYAKHEFGKNVYNVKAYNAAGKPLTVTKDDADVYRVTGHKGTVKLQYTLFGNHADGTYTSIDASGYHLNIPSTFMWIKGLEKAPLSVNFSVRTKVGGLPLNLNLPLIRTLIVRPICNILWIHLSRSAS